MGIFTKTTKVPVTKEQREIVRQRKEAIKIGKLAKRRQVLEKRQKLAEVRESQEQKIIAARKRINAIRQAKYQRQAAAVSKIFGTASGFVKKGTSTARRIKRKAGFTKRRSRARKKSFSGVTWS